MIAEHSLVFRLWAKTAPFHPLPCHLIDVGNVTQALVKTSAFAATAARAGAAIGCPTDVLPAWLAYFTALHDIGKCHHDFQGRGPDQYIMPLKERGLSCVVQDRDYRHEGLSALWVQKFLMSDLGLPVQLSRTVGQALRGHHGDFGAPAPEEPEFQHDTWEALRRELEAIVRRVLAPRDWRPVEVDHSVFGLLLSGLLVWSDWIASNQELFPRRVYTADVEDYAPQSALVAMEAIEKLGLDITNPWREGEPFLHTWRTLRIDKARPVQRRCEELARTDAGPGLWIIEAPMGEGKTEAAVYLATQWGARGHNGTYVALPTAATGNQMFDRVKAFLKDRDPELAAGARLVHGQAWLVGEDAAVPSVAPGLSGGSQDESHLALEWFRPKKRSLLAPYGVGTIDQALFSVLHVKHGFLRLFGLSGKVLIVDEVHAYDPYMSRILTRLLRWCRALQIPVILLSATLPEARRRALVEAYAPEANYTSRFPGEYAPYPLVTTVSSSGETAEHEVAGERRRRHIRVHRYPGFLENPEKLASLALDLVAQGGCLCVLVNTVDTAQRVFQAIEGRMRPDDSCRLLLFHARFRACRRREIEEEVVRLFGKRSLLNEDEPGYVPRPRRAILVATQVVEQSADVDFDEMITELPPADLLLQRVGREHRHSRAQRPTGDEARLHVAWPEACIPPVLGKTERVYQRFVLLKTMAALVTREMIVLPDDIRPMIEGVYDGRPWAEGAELVSNEEDFRREESLSEDEREADEARKYLIPEPNPREFRLAQLRLGAFDEEESGAASYFRARTRLGDDTMSVLLLEGTALAEELASSRAPERRVLAEIMMNSVSLPRYWWTGVAAEEGFTLPEPGPSWLPGQYVLRLRGGEWRGRRGAESVVIRDNPDHGVLLKRGE
ncbi:MAG: CRISPR-associated helicase Cas3' [Firmicutes bacterium]|nr:CRISPR-associated helicase Cas3' [Bacillota bacterium]